MKVFWIGTSLLAAATTADAVTTRMALDRGAAESNAVFGPHPSVARQVGVNVAIFAAQTALFYFTERNRHKWIRWSGRMYVGLTVVNHAKLAACNAGIQVRNAPVDVSCRGVPGF